MGKFKDIAGQRFGRLVAIKAEKDPTGRRYDWLCKCDCGNEVKATSVSLTTGKKKSCGCIQRELLQSRNTVHGHSRERLYRVWKGMKSRCYNSHHRSYPKYGGRGLRVCDDYEAFRLWAYENGYDENAEYQQCTIDRIDVDGDYSPQNCRWADSFTQANNTNKVLLITFKGETKTVTEWANKTGIPRATLYARVKNGWDVDKALTTPVRTLHMKCAIS